MLKEKVSTANAPTAIGPYSQGIKLGDFIFVSGQIPIDVNTGDLVSNDIEVQTRQCLKNVEAILNAAGLNFTHVLKTVVYMTDLSEFEAMNKIYAEYFSEPYPTRSTLQVSALPKGAKIEIEAYAIDTVALEVVCKDNETCCHKDGCCE